MQHILLASCENYPCCVLQFHINNAKEQTKGKAPGNIEQSSLFRGRAIYSLEYLPRRLVAGALHIKCMQLCLDCANCAATHTPDSISVSTAIAYTVRCSYVSLQSGTSILGAWFAVTK